jgi:hypothetical protein
VCHIEAEEGAGVNGNLLSFMLFMAIALVLTELVTETVFRRKFLFLALVAAGIGLVALQDSWLQRRPRFYRLVLETPEGRKVVLQSPSREAVEAAERNLLSAMGRSRGA